MRLPRFALMLCSLAVLACSSIAAAASSALDRFGRLILDTFAPDTKPLALAGMPSAPMTIDGVALARSTQQGLRHEAGIPRRAAPRNV